MMLSPDYSSLTVYRQSRSLSALLPERETEGVNDVLSKEKINAGRQLCMCIHKCSFKNVDMDMLTAPSDQSGQTHWSEIVQTVTGSLLPAAVRLAPFYTALNVSLSQTEAAYV